MTEEQFGGYYDEVSGRVFKDKDQKKEFFKYYIWAYYQATIEKMYEEIDRNVEKFHEKLSDFVEDIKKTPVEDKNVIEAGTFDAAIYEKIHNDPKYTIKNEERDKYDQYIKEGMDAALFVVDRKGTNREKFNLNINMGLLSERMRQYHVAIAKDYRLLAEKINEGGIDNAREEATKAIYERLKNNLKVFTNELEEKGVPKEQFSEFKKMLERIDEVMDVTKHRSQMVNGTNDLQKSIRRYSRTLSMTLLNTHEKRNVISGDKSEADKENNSIEKDKAIQEKKEKIKNQLAKSKEDTDNIIKTNIENPENVSETAQKDITEISNARQDYLDSTEDFINDIETASIEDIEDSVNKIGLARDRTFRTVAEKYSLTYSQKLPDATLIEDILGGKKATQKGTPEYTFASRFNSLQSNLDLIKKMYDNGELGKDDKTAEEQKISRFAVAMGMIQGDCEFITNYMNKSNNKKLKNLLGDPIKDILDFTRVGFGFMGPDETLYSDAQDMLKNCQKIKTNFKELQTEQDIEDMIKNPRKRSKSAVIDNHREKRMKNPEMEMTDETKKELGRASLGRQGFLKGLDKEKEKEKQKNKQKSLGMGSF